MLLASVHPEPTRDVGAVQWSPLEREEREQALDVAGQADSALPGAELEASEKAQLRPRPLLALSARAA
jgi:hypothetical protein